MVMVMAAEAEAEAEERAVEFEDLPEGCIANVLSFTTPRDACALSLVSSTFRSAAQSDVVWDRFLPSDYRSIISQSQSQSPLSHTSKKDLYLHLCREPLLIDAGKKSFALEKLYGKKCYMLAARALSIVWGDTPRYWRWISLPEARFSEVAELVSVCWLEIRGGIMSGMLSGETLYGAYLVYKTTVAGSYSFQVQPVEVSVGIAGEPNHPNRTVYLDAPKPRRRRRYYQIIPRQRGHRNLMATTVEETEQTGPESPTEPPVDVDVNSNRSESDGVNKHPKERGDGWLEIELGEFFNRGCDQEEDKEVEMAVCEVKSGDWKSGLLLQGIEIRPKLIKR